MKNSLISLILFLSLFFGAVAAKSPADQENDDALRVKVIEYLEDGRYDDYINGGHEVNDVFVLQILTPKKYYGKSLSIFHQVPLKKESKLRKVGTKFSFSLDDKMLKELVNPLSSLEINFETIRNSVVNIEVRTNL